MSKKIKSKTFIAALAFLVCFALNCNQIEIEEADPEPYTLKLSWHEGSMIPGYSAFIAGINWYCSTLGAMLPQQGAEAGITEINREQKVMSFDFSLVGFSSEALESLKTIIAEFKGSDYYQNFGHVEWGRFMMLTLNSSFHYYEITNMPATLSEFEKGYHFQETSAMVINSTVSQTERRIKISEANDYKNIAYVSEEGHFDSLASTFEIVEFEVTDLLPSGQFRFGIYDQKGRLIKGSDPLKTAAGKPAKCLWCHESHIQPFFTQKPLYEAKDFLSEEAFLKILDEYSEIIRNYRSNLVYPLFDSLQHHNWMEKIYLDFMEPTLAQIAFEWGITEDEAADIVKNLETHTQVEFQVGSLYHRKDVDLLSAFKSLKVPDSPRETSEFEPNFFP